MIYGTIKNVINKVAGKIIGKEDRLQRNRWFDENVK